MSNNFKELERMHIQGRIRPQEETKRKINANIHFFGFVGSIVDVYLPKVGEVITAFNQPQDATSNKNKKYPNQ
jgi:hypothetical protein